MRENPTDRDITFYFSTTMFPLCPPFPFFPKEVLQRIANQIPYFFNIKVQGESVTPVSLIHSDFIFVIRDNLATGHRHRR